MNIINQASINAVVAIGASLVILTGGIDLSVGSVVGFVGIFLALRLQEGMPIPVAIILCLVLGAAVGLFNGILISYGKVPAFIVTLGSMQSEVWLRLSMEDRQYLDSRWKSELL